MRLMLLVNDTVKSPKVSDNKVMISTFSTVNSPTLFTAKSNSLRHSMVSAESNVEGNLVAEKIRLCGMKLSASFFNLFFELAGVVKANDFVSLFFFCLRASTESFSSLDDFSPKVSVAYLKNPIYPCKVTDSSPRVKDCFCI